MSECVVRMEIPQGCWCCPFGHYDWIWGDDGREKMVCFCCLDGESEEDGHYLLETEQKRPSWCPIICQLPEGHGRLVDADKEIDFHVNDFERLTAEDIDVYSNAYSLSDLCDGITYAYDHADIIVPAEVERSET